MAEQQGAESGVYRHQSVLSQEAVSGLAPVSGGVYVDATLGGGGHACAILEASSPDGLLLAMDRDDEAIGQGHALLERFPGRLKLYHSPFGNLATLLATEKIAGVQGILFDLGVSSRQLDTAGRGFSFMRDGPLDMRMDPSQGRTAADLVNTLPEGELADILYSYGEERQARRLARIMVAARQQAPLTTTRQLADLVERVMPRHERIHPATRTFQALRMAVNSEMEQLAHGLWAAFHALAPGGRLAVISFHSLEDRMVKQFIQRLARPQVPQSPDPRVQAPPALLTMVHRKPITPGEAECAANPRARSAKLRIAERLATPALHHPVLAAMAAEQQAGGRWP